MKKRAISPARMVMGKPRTIMFIKGAAFERRPNDRFTRNKTQSKGKAILRAEANILQKSWTVLKERISDEARDREETELNEEITA